MKKTIRLTESDLIRLVKKIIKESSNTILEQEDSGCLRKAGFTRESIGGPMTRRMVYEKNYNGTTYQIDITQNDIPTKKLRIINNKNTQVCSSWTCDSNSNIGIKFQGCVAEKLNLY